MAQINLHTTPEFEDDLAKLMRGRGIRSKSEAIRTAVHEAADDARGSRPVERDWSVIGIAARTSEPAPATDLQKELRDLRWQMDREMMEQLGVDVPYPEDQRK